MSDTPKLPCHPEPHTYTWTAEELRVIEEYGRACAQEAQQEIERLKTVMVAAAEEIHAHWQAHCDAEGYGPANLMRRLEEGIAAEYGYTAGAFAAAQQEIERLRLDNEGLLQACNEDATRLDRAEALLREAHGYVQQVVNEQAQAWGNRLQHKQEPDRKFLAAVEAFLAPQEQE